MAGRGECNDTFDDTFVPGAVFKFKQDCDEFSAGQDLALAALALPLRALPTTFEIHGYTSVDGPAAFNQDLGCARAMEAKRLLTDTGRSGDGISREPNHRRHQSWSRRRTSGRAAERRDKDDDSTPARATVEVPERVLDDTA